MRILLLDEVRFDAPTHTYHDAAGNAYPSVTTVLKPWSLLNHVPEACLQHARMRGETVHLATEMHDDHTLDEDTLDAETLMYLDGWRKFRADWEFSVLSSEEKVIHSTFGYAGTLDRYGIGRPPGSPRHYKVLLDIKTGQPDPTHGPQTAAYARALLDAGHKIERRLTVYLKPGGYKVEQHFELEDWTIFMAALQWHRWKQRHGI